MTGAGHVGVGPETSVERLDLEVEPRPALPTAIQNVVGSGGGTRAGKCDPATLRRSR
jgi:hypothetical protein